MSPLDNALAAASTSHVNAMGEEVCIGGLTVVAVVTPIEYARTLGSGGFMTETTTIIYVSREVFSRIPLLKGSVKGQTVELVERQGGRLRLLLPSDLGGAGWQLECGPEVLRA